MNKNKLNKQEQEELKKKVMEFLVDEWEHGVPLDRLKNRDHIENIIEWLENNNKNQNNNKNNNGRQQTQE